MSAPANPPMERSEVTVKGETMSVMSGVFVSPVVSYCNHTSESQHDAIWQPIDTYRNKVGKVLPIGNHHLLSGKDNT